MHDRANERAELRRLLAAGASVQMFAERRIGKTWLLKALERDLRPAGWIVARVDVEGMKTEAELLKALCAALETQTTITQRLRAHLGHRFRNLLGGGWEGAPIQALAKVDPKDFALALVESIAQEDRAAVIMVDEVALFVLQIASTDPEAAHAFLYHIRNLQQRFPEVRWILTGSIGLDVVGRRYNLLGALVDFETFALHPFDDAEARSYLESYCRDAAPHHPFTFASGVLERLLDELGWLSPYYLKLVADRIRPSETSPGGARQAKLEDVERAFEAVLSPHFRTHFSVWEEHIDKNFPAEEARQLHAILSILCGTPDGEIGDTLRAALAAEGISPSGRELKTRLTDLYTGGFLSEAEGRWRFRSGLLRRYWLRYVAD